ncbi:MAG: outer membrane lipoprotein carrier protein LolA [Paludibacteraceae bacterium]|nr:outer membrane lipoprotein carrier protein LolA [Paludibacteraceae bacterium]
MLAFIIAAIVSLQADFVQTKHSAMFSEPQVSTGKMIYRAPSYLLWAYEQPGNIVWEIDGEQSNVNPHVQRLLRMIMASIASEGKTDTTLDRESKKLFQSVTVRMDEHTNIAQQVELIEKKGDTTIIEFNNVIAK